MMEAARTSETSFDNYFTRQYIPEDKSELHIKKCMKSPYFYLCFITAVVFKHFHFYSHYDFMCGFVKYFLTPQTFYGHRSLGNNTYVRGND
jgi:hypothetical protein